MEGNELLEAVRAGELERVKVLVEQDTGVDKDNALRWAAREGRLEVVKYLKEQGADCGAKDWYGDTALMRAAHGGYSEVVRFLVEECGVDVNASNTNDCTALMWAVRSGEVEVVRYLAGQSGINVDAKDNYGYTALMKACKGGRVAIVQCLVEAGSDVDESDGLGHTPLMIASGCGHREIVWHLVERCHAVLNSRNNRGETAVRLASDCGYRDVERYLTSHSPLSYVSAAPTSTTDSDIDESATTSISPSEIDPVDFSTSSSMGTDYRRATWLKADATLILAIPHSDHSVLEEKVRLWQALRHPNVMDIYGICRAVPQLQLLVCEHSNKGPLIGFVKSSSVAMPLVWKYLHEAAVGLAYFHGRGLAHGDLRCSNIFIGNDGTAKLFNFDLGGVLEKSSSVSTGPIGSIRWQSPEILRGEQPSSMSDVYSLGMCILEVVTRRIPWEDCGSDICVRDLKMRWTPESAGDENLGPKCPLGNEKDLIWRICCQNPEKRVSLASLVGELRNLAMEDGSTPEPGFDYFGDDSIRKMWMTIQTDMIHCDDDFLHEAFDEIKKVREHLLVSPFRTALLKQFGALVRGIRAMTIGSREHSVVLKLSVPSDISSSRVAFRQLLRSTWKALGETTELARGRKERWKHYGWLQTEIIISEVSDSYVLLGEVKTRGERSKLLASLRAEIDQSFKYTPGELGLLKKAFDDISSRVEIDALSKLTPQWFIPWYELLVGEWDYLREVEFGRVHRAKWHDADVVIKRAVLADTPDSDSTLSVKDSLLDTPSASQDQRNAIQQSEELAAFRHEVDIWFGLNHPHVIRLFGACHVGTPFFVCEYAPNGTMVSYLRKHPDEIWSKLLDVALGVQYLHARGIVHGDLKGNNIVIAGDLKAKVADFSTSFVARDDARSLISGAWHWLAPECFDGTQPPTFASDVYSLGMCVVEALRVVEAVKARQESRSSFPWRDLDRNSVKYYATKGSLPTRPSICEDCQWELVERMCALDSKKRIPIAEVVDELTRLASSRHNDSIAISRTESLELGSIPQLAATAQRRLAKLQQDSKQEELTSVLLLYVSLWNRLEQIHGQSSYRDNDDLPAEFFSLVGEVDAATSELQDSNRSLFALAVLALRCYASERCLNKLGGKETDLMWAARNGQIQVVQSLIDGGADVNAQDDEGQTALMAAAEYDQIDIVRYLIKHGASLTATDNIGDTVLMITAGKGLVRVCQHLADHSGTDVNARYTALMTAAVNGHAQVVQYLAGHQGVDVNAADEYGYTPLMMATLSGATDVVRCLAEEYGADVNAKAREGDTALILAAVVGHIEVFRYFTERRGLDVNVKNNNGETALMMAAANGNIAVVRSITGYGVDVNVENTRGYTALMNAAKNGHVEIVQCLLEQRGIDANHKNQRGETAIRLAVGHGYQEIRRMLTPFLPLHHRLHADEIHSSKTPLRASIPPSEVEFTRFCRNGSIGGEYLAKWLDADAVVRLFVPDASTTTFDEEVHLWQQLRHPNVMKMYGACTAPPNLQFFVCEHISNGSLIEYVELTSMGMPTVWKFLHEAALGLTYLHERGILHRDLRCSNILIGSDGLAKLSNFDLSGSKTPTDGDQPDMTNVRSIRWQAPEILRGEPWSVESDVYSLGMCILEAMTREQPWGCETEHVVEKYKTRWTPEADAANFCEPDCPPGDARNLVWKLCSNDAAQRASLSLVVDELERLAIADRPNSLQPEYEPTDDTERGKIKELWLDVQRHMETCSDDKYHLVYNELKRVCERWQDSESSSNSMVLERLHALLTDFYRVITMSPEQASIARLSSTRATTTSLELFYSRIELMMTVLGESADTTTVRKDRWQQQRREQIELFVSGVEDTSFLLERLKTAEERAVFLKTLAREIDDPESQYNPVQLQVVKKAHADIARALASEDLSKLIPEWFIPRFELFVDGWRCLGRGGFGCVYRAKWLGSDVVAKFLGAESEAEGQSSLSALLDTRSVMDSPERGDAVIMFRREVDIWFGFNHPHVIRLFGACHVGTPFFACEYATNGTLVEYLKTHPGELWTKLHEAALGVQYLHARKVVHGDLKGNNIVIGSDMKAKVTDFGLSSIAGNEDRPQISGAWHWVAPECLPDAKKTATNPGSKIPTFESDIYSLGMCIVEAFRVVENVGKMKVGQESQPCLPWRGLDNFLVRFHATNGELPSQPTICSDEQWALVKQMCAFKPKERMKISTVVDRLAQLANRQKTTASATSEQVILNPVRAVIEQARDILDRLRCGTDQADAVLTLYESLWGRLENTHETIVDKEREECRNAFYSLVVEANRATSELQCVGDSLISQAAVTMRYYALDRCLDKFCDAYHRVLRPE